MFRLFSLFFKDSPIINKYLSISGITIFMLYIIYNTNEILLKYKNNKDYCIKGAYDYYLDIINIFVKLLEYKKSESKYNK